MRFRQLDTITELDPGKRIVARRTLHAEEDYLRDHFPHFPVMPGVMMLEAAYQAAMWMVRTGDDFAHPLVLMREAKQRQIRRLSVARRNVGDRGRAGSRGRAAGHGQSPGPQRRPHDGFGAARPGTLLLPSDPRLGRNEDVRRRVRKQFTELFGELPALWLLLVRFML